jgi:hypothetical protein
LVSLVRFPVVLFLLTCGGDTERKGRCKGKVIHASLFGVGAPEALVIGVVALLVFGPKGLAEVSCVTYLLLCPFLKIFCSKKSGNAGRVNVTLDKHHFVSVVILFLHLKVSAHLTLFSNSTRQGLLNCLLPMLWNSVRIV